MTEIDYSKYSYDDLVDILSRIQKDKYPEKVKAIEQQIELKKNEYKPPKYFSLFGQERILYKNKFFIITFIVLLSILSIINLINILIAQKIIAFIILPFLIGTLVLILSSHPKSVTAIKIMSVFFIVLGAFSLVTVALEILLYLLKTEEEYSYGLNLDIYTGVIIFFIGLFYFIKVDKNVIINNDDKIVA